MLKITDVSNTFEYFYVDVWLCVDYTVFIAQHLRI
jgi:hypothetical protein